MHSFFQIRYLYMDLNIRISPFGSVVRHLEQVGTRTENAKILINFEHFYLITLLQ